jgi:glycosyltransferase involved in cell wall biosynthesis
MIIRSADQVTAISKYLADIAVSLGRNNVQVIRNGIDYDAIRVACEKSPKVPGRILFVGRLEKMKGVDLLLEAFAKLQVARPNGLVGRAGCRLHIVGDGSQRASLQSLSRELGITDHVSFRGHLPSSNVHREYAEAEFFCGLSRSEALGNVFIEAQAAGCAVIATNTGGIPELVKDRNNGVLIPTNDVVATANALGQLMGESSLMAKYATAGIQNAAAYDWKLIANQYAEIYKSFTLSGL